MKEKKLSIQINKPASEIFTFTLNPANTPRWVNSIVNEEVSELPTKLGTIYRNIGQNGKWNSYTVTEFEDNRMFVLTSKDNNYHCRYTFRPIDENTTEFEYYEWVDKGILEDPFTPNILEKLR